MYQTYQLSPSVTLRCVEAQRFKQGRLSIQFLRPMCREEAALNALVPSILLRGTARNPDIRAITQRLDDLYGASVGEIVRRVGDYQAVGLSFGFIEDRFALSGDRILEPVLDFARELLLEPLLENGCFVQEFVSGEKRNLIANIESQLNDKRAYASAQLMKKMCSADSYGIPRLGTKTEVEAIDPISAYQHYLRILSESPVEVFYVGSGNHEVVAEKIREMLAAVCRCPITLPEQTPFRDGGGGEFVETMEISQGRLCMGFTTPVTSEHEQYPAMQVFNYLFGSGMTSKLFNQIREKMSLCYSIGSGLFAGKGIMTVSAGIDSDKFELVKAEIVHQLQLCCEGDIAEAELTAAKNAIISALQGVYDSPGSIEGYTFVMAMAQDPVTPEERCRQIESVTMQQVIEVAHTFTLHTTYFLKGVEA